MRGRFILAAVLSIGLSRSAHAVTRNVREMGAAGDGQADDTAVVQRALDAAEPGDIVLLPTGTYRVTAPLHATRRGAILKGEGKTSVLRASEPGYSLVEAQADDLAFRSLTFQGTATTDKTRQFGIFTAKPVARGGVVTNCWFTGPDPRTGLNCGVKLDTGCDGWRIEGCTFDRLIGAVSGTGYGVLLGAAENVRISKNRFSGTDEPLLEGRHAVYLSGGASNNHVIDNTIKGFNQSSIAIYARTAQPPCRANEVRNNHISDQRLGFSGTASVELTGNVRDNVIAENIIERPGRHGIIVSDGREGGKATGNHLIGNRIVSAAQFGILLEGASSTEVSDNTILDASVSSPGSFSAVQIQAFTAGEYKQAADGNIVTGNTIQDAGGEVSYRWAIVLNETEPTPSNTVLSLNRTKAGKLGRIQTASSRQTTTTGNDALP